MLQTDEATFSVVLLVATLFQHPNAQCHSAQQRWNSSAMAQQKLFEIHTGFSVRPKTGEQSAGARE
jgi:hypothetical protein